LETKNIKKYKRLSYNGTSIYIDPEKPDWFIPTKNTDFLLQKINENNSLQASVLEYSRLFGADIDETFYRIRNFLSRLENGSSDEYKGRHHYRKTEVLKECWFHITNQCNINCTHCMFSSYDRSGAGLSCEDVSRCFHEAFALGCRVFYFTGGEPFLSHDFISLCNEILKKEDTHIVILTNGKDINRFDKWLQSLPKERAHFQLSIDGTEKNHDAFRGKGAFQELLRSFRYLKSLGFPITLAMLVNKKNVRDMSAIVDLAGDYKIENIHYLWLFQKGKADKSIFAEPGSIVIELIKAYEKAIRRGISIDNFEIIKSQIFSLSGTRFDLSNAAWESLAIGPDGKVYPSPALIFEEELAAGNISEGLENIWKNSPVLRKIRRASLIGHEKYRNNPFKYLIGGGDIDHSYIAGKTLVGDDPYTAIYSQTALYLLSSEADSFSHHDNGHFGMLCRMGERLYECDEDAASVGFTHSNCVLSLPGRDGYSLVKSFYSRAAEEVNEDIVNPVHYGEQEISHIPLETRLRSYGCGSPVLDCNLQPDEVLLDLGSGTGVECFIASKKVGPGGKVYGIDMSDTMLGFADRSLKTVSENLGYSNIEFKKGFLEKIPLSSETVDVVISNCVINLSPDKRRTFGEILRILQPGGRLCISDIVCNDDIPLDIRYNEKLRGECIGGAMKEKELFSLLEDLMFENIYVKKRFLYRRVRGYNFYSVTYSAFKAKESVTKSIIYRGPFPAVVTDDGRIIERGNRIEIPLSIGIERNENFFILDENGNPVNIEQEITCSCFTAPEQKKENPLSSQKAEKHATGCLVCGADLVYLDQNENRICSYCQKGFSTNAVCREGHFVCDACHSEDAIEIIRDICLESRDKDMIALFNRIRSHPAVPLHGPEHHSLVPAVILTAYRNLGGDVGNGDIEAAINRGKTIAGGACSFLGICGAATGAGIAFSLMMKANPYKAKERQTVQKITNEVLTKISDYEAPRCCQRDCWLALKAVADLSERYLPFALKAEEELCCNQYQLNKECIGKACPLLV
jgi:MoaA/NifB/PqqE/SkfB family radical SAM enzyme/ubiquinone/menaquinone biosynthesis C-methylase UbiE